MVRFARWIRVAKNGANAKIGKTPSGRACSRDDSAETDQLAITSTPHPVEATQPHPSWRTDSHHSRTLMPAVNPSYPQIRSVTCANGNLGTAQTEAQGDSTFDGGNDDFLSREKALLGDDANQFTTNNDNAAFVEDGDDDLLGSGGGSGGNEEVTEFESSFPAIDSRNEVCSPLHPMLNQNLLLRKLTRHSPGRRTRRQHHRHNRTLPIILLPTLQRARARSNHAMARTSRSPTPRP